MAEKPIFARIHFSRAPVCTPSSPEGKRCADPTKSFTWWRAGVPRILTQKPTIRRNRRTFRPKKSAPSGKGAQLRQHIDATLGSGNLREAVRLPPGEDFNEWLAVNTVDFFNQVNPLYGTLTEFCT